MRSLSHFASRSFSNWKRLWQPVKNRESIQTLSRIIIISSRQNHIQKDLDGIPVIHVRHVPLSSSFNNAIKRIVDLFGGIVALIIFAIPMLLLSLIIKITSPGPLIFKQVRVGLHNREFAMYKFR